MLPVRIWNGTGRQLHTCASLSNGEYILRNCGGVILLPEARELEKGDVQKEEIQAEQHSENRKQRLLPGPDGVPPLVLIPVRGVVFPPWEVMKASCLLLKQ